MKKQARKLVNSLSIFAVLSMVACGGSPEEATTDTTETAAPQEEVVVEEFDIIMIHEDGFSHQDAAERNEAKKHEGHDHGDHDHHEHASPAKASLANPEAAPQAEEIHSYMVNKSFKRVEIEDTEELQVPVEVNQTVVAFDKNANFEGQVHVVSSSETGEVTNIVFTGKHHMDEYNIAAGLTGKEAKQLRKDLKHMTKKGRIYLYEEGSNIMYIMDAKDLTTGEEISQDDIDNMTIEAIIWQDTSDMKESAKK